MIASVLPSWAYNLKTVGAQRACPLPSPFCVSHRMDAALNSSEQMHFPQTKLHQDTTVGCEVVTPLKRCIVQVGLGHGRIHEPN